MEILHVNNYTLKLVVFYSHRHKLFLGLPTVIVALALNVRSYYINFYKSKQKVFI